MTRKDIEQLDDTSPHSFETDREEWWYQIGLKDGLQTADQHPSPDVIKKIVCYALTRTNIMLADNLEDDVEWELLIKKAMED